MKTLALLVVGLSASFALPAFAQSSPSPGSSSSSTSSSPGAPAKSDATPSTDPAKVRQNITSDLEKDGFKNVHIVADSFLVNAENKEGQKVVMIINPDSVFSMTEVPQSGSSASKSSDSGTSGSASSSASKSSSSK